MEQFGLKTRIIMGDGLDSLTAGMKKAFVVTDSFMAQSGKVSYVTDKLNRAGVEWQVFSDIAGCAGYRYGDCQVQKKLRSLSRIQ